MRQLVLQTLTWGTVSAAIASAFWLAAADLDRAAEWRNPLAVPEAPFALPVEPANGSRTPSRDERTHRSAAEQPHHTAR